MCCCVSQETWKELTLIIIIAGQKKYCDAREGCVETKSIFEQ
jgi:hypothetical protein